MGFNAAHHHDEETKEPVVHVHADGKKHEHHKEATKPHHHSKENSEKEGGCCNDDVVKFQRRDKNLQHSNTAVGIPNSIAILTSFFGLDIFPKEQISSEKHIARFFHPPPPDIRILIRSFQI